MAGTMRAIRQMYKAHRREKNEEPMAVSVEIAKLQAQMQKQLEDAMAMGVIHGHAHPIGPPQAIGIGIPPIQRPPIIPSIMLARRCLELRMRWQEHQHPFQDMHVTMGKEVVLLYIVIDDKPVIIEDRSGMFPCDETITKLRMLQP